MPRLFGGMAPWATGPRWLARTGESYGVKHGDIVEASMVGTRIKGYINGVEVISVEDEVFEDGAPGIGFNFYVGNTNVDHGFKLVRGRNLGGLGMKSIRHRNLHRHRYLDTKKLGQPLARGHLFHDAIKASSPPATRLCRAHAHRGELGVGRSTVREACPNGLASDGLLEIRHGTDGRDRRRSVSRGRGRFRIA